MAAFSGGLRMPSKKPEDFECPICGVRESEGGCEDLRACEEALVRMEEKYTEEITQLLDLSSDLLSAVLKALDPLSIGAAVTNASGQLLFANQTADHILASRDGLELTARGELCTSRGCCSPSLAELRQRAAAGVSLGTPGIFGATLLVQRPSGKRAVTLLLRCFNGPSSKLGLSASAALVFILDPDYSRQAAQVEVRQLYGLTPKEACLASLLMEGKTLAESCNDLGICVSTGRMHLKRLFSKTDIHSQSQLVSLMNSLGLVRTRGILSCSDEQHFS